MTNYKSKVIILGAKGRFGRAAMHAFLDADWQVTAFARSWGNVDLPENVERQTGDAFNATDITCAAQGCDVIVNALNLPYQRWSRDLPRLTDAIIQAAKTTGATIMLPGNVYNYGEGMPMTLAEETAHRPTSRKGLLRVDMETSYRDAAKEGVQTIILRAGDFIEREKTGNWFDSQITGKINKGQVMYPGPLDRVHAWAYLPDLARAFVGVAKIRDALSKFEEFGFPGYTLTGRALVAALERASKRSLKVKSMPWPMIRVLGWVIPQMREVAEMAYLWDTPHGIDGAKLARALPDFQETPFDIAIAEALGSVSANPDGKHKFMPRSAPA
jgi:nucleoside-diphosphate-sugar epimerase